jgi:hypothetical protein
MTDDEVEGTGLHVFSTMEDHKELVVGEAVQIQVRVQPYADKGEPSEV